MVKVPKRILLDANQNQEDLHFQIKTVIAEQLGLYL